MDAGIGMLVTGIVAAILFGHWGGAWYWVHAIPAAPLARIERIQRMRARVRVIRQGNASRAITSALRGASLDDRILAGRERIAAIRIRREGVAA